MSKKETYYIQEFEFGWAVVKSTINGYDSSQDEEVMYVCDSENKACNVALSLAKATGNDALLPVKRPPRPIPTEEEVRKGLKAPLTPDERRQRINELMETGVTYEKALEITKY